MNGWRIVALVAILALVASLGYSFRLASVQEDPLDVLKCGLTDTGSAIECIEEGDPSYYVRLSMIGNMARRGDVSAMRALMTVSELAWGAQNQDFLSYWLAEIATSQPELFLALCSRMGEDASNTVETAARGMAHFLHRESTPVAGEPLLQAAREIDATAAWIGKEVKKARRVEPRQEAEETPGESG